MLVHSLNKTYSQEVPTGRRCLACHINADYFESPSFFFLEREMDLVIKYVLTIRCPTKYIQQQPETH